MIHMESVSFQGMLEFSEISDHPSQPMRREAMIQIFTNIGFMKFSMQIRDFFSQHSPMQWMVFQYVFHSADG